MSYKNIEFFGFGLFLNVTALNASSNAFLNAFFWGDFLSDLEAAGARPSARVPERPSSTR
jgi:hypothetical protein